MPDRILKRRKRSLIFAAIAIVFLLVYPFNTSYHTLVDANLTFEVDTISAEALIQERNSNNKVILLDTRSEAEYAVSHIPGAIRMEHTFINVPFITDLPHGSRVVTYCTIGYRSELAAIAIQKERPDLDISNLYGGIIDWVKVDGELVNNQNISTQKIHPYSKEWEEWVTKGEVAYE